MCLALRASGLWLRYATLQLWFTSPLQDDLGTRFCICVKRRNAYGRNNYEPICGECRDPCALRFVPDKFGPRRDDYSGNRNNNPETKK